MNSRQKIAALIDAQKRRYKSPKTGQIGAKLAPLNLQPRRQLRSAPRLELYIDETLRRIFIKEVQKG